MPLVINGLGGGHTDTHTQAHTDTQTKVISRNQARVAKGLKTERLDLVLTCNLIILIILIQYYIMTTQCCDTDTVFQVYHISLQFIMYGRIVG